MILWSSIKWTTFIIKSAEEVAPADHEEQEEDEQEKSSNTLSSDCLGIILDNVGPRSREWRLRKRRCSGWRRNQQSSCSRLWTQERWGALSSRHWTCVRVESDWRQGAGGGGDEARLPDQSIVTHAPSYPLLMEMLFRLVMTVVRSCLYERWFFLLIRVWWRIIRRISLHLS